MGAERGAAGLGGESADLRLQPQTLLGSAESNLQVHTSLALKVATLSLQIADSFFLQRLQMGSARCHTCSLYYTLESETQRNDYDERHINGHTAVPALNTKNYAL